MEEKSLYLIDKDPSPRIWKSLIQNLDLYRIDANQKLDPEQRSKMGQFFTPPVVANFMASLFGDPPKNICLLDAGAGVGLLAGAFVENVCNRDKSPDRIVVTAYELDPLLVEYLHASLSACQEFCAERGIVLTGEVIERDFIRSGADMLWGGLFPIERKSFNRVILNPPYKKIRSNSEHRRLLSSIGIETSNLYSAFVAIAVQLLEPGGELVAITPRSFCNGPYFKPFRKLFLNGMTLRRVHLFTSRDETFRDDDVLQENIIFHAVKKGEKEKVIISTSQGPDFGSMTLNEVAYEQVVKSNDPDLIIHLATSAMDQAVLDRIGVFDQSLDNLGISVSTGRVVDFRIKDHLRATPENGTVPLIYPAHFSNGYIQWPKPESKKPNAISVSPASKALLLPNGNYVLVKRFTSKEEPRRIVAVIYSEENDLAPFVGFENHLNVYHLKNDSLPNKFARGIAVYLNSTLVDRYFRQFNGHTQVNATDLRMLPYPNKETLEKLGAKVGEVFPHQHEIDTWIDKEIKQMADIQSPDPVIAQKRIREAIEVIEMIGLPRAQQNERSALTLLALLNLKPELPWSAAESPLMGITLIMDFVREYYGIEYAPNTRETFRRQTMHQFVDAGLAIPNPDDPARPVNSPKFCYQIEKSALELLRVFGANVWNEKVQTYLSTVETLKQKYEQMRAMQMVPVVIAEEKEIYLSSGAHSRLLKAIIEEFAPRYVPGGEVIYIGDTGDKWGYFDENLLQDLGVSVDMHGKMPDVVIHHTTKDWLLLIEAVTSHGPVDPKRHVELQQLFQDARPGLLYVTVFLTRKDFTKYASSISWQTEVWIQENGTHLIHFDGERFLGPYDG